MPTMAIQNGTVTLRQEARADFVVHGVEAELHTDGDGLVVSGTTSDPTWGKWELTASFHRQGGESSLTLKTTGMHLSQPMLDSLPFVAPSVWREVQLEGKTPVELTVRFTPTTGEVSYRVAFEPKATKVQVTSIDLHAEDASGLVVVEDGVVHLRDVRGKSADGEITTAADMDFRRQPQHLRFQVAVDRLNLEKVSKSWGVTGPQFQGGRLTGQAELRVTLAQGKSKISGQGEGVIRDLRIFRTARPGGAAQTGPWRNTVSVCASGSTAPTGERPGPRADADEHRLAGRLTGGAVAVGPNHQIYSRGACGSGTAHP